MHKFNSETQIYGMVTLHFVMVNVHTSNLSKGTSDDRGIWYSGYVDKQTFNYFTGLGKHFLYGNYNAIFSKFYILCI